MAKYEVGDVKRRRIKKRGEKKFAIRASKNIVLRPEKSQLESTK